MKSIINEEEISNKKTTSRKTNFLSLKPENKNVIIIWTEWTNKKLCIKSLQMVELYLFEMKAKHNSAM